MRFLRAWLPVILWMAVIFVFSGRESVRVDERFIINFLFFKSLHVVEYGILYILYYRALKNALVAFVLTTAYAITDEFHQAFVPTREGRVRDVIIDAFGGIIAWGLIVLWLPKAPEKLTRLVRRLELL